MDKLKKITTKEKFALQRKANELAKRINGGDEQAWLELNELIAKNAYIANLVQRMIRNLKKQKVTKGKGGKGKGKKGSGMKGSVMTGLTGVTSARGWSHVK